jgi:hypothetical protein
MTKKVLDKLTGGFSAREPQIIDDNQFVELKNWFYNNDKRLQTRRGYHSDLFPVLPDTVVLIDALNADTGWSASDDAASLTTGTAIRGTNSLSFAVDVSASGTDQATITKSTLAADISLAKGYIGFWLYVPAAFNTNLTAFKLRLGTDSSNYYEWTLPTLTEATAQFIKLDFADATETGTVNDASIAYARFQITYAATYTDKAGIRIDDIQAYSATYAEPVTSYFFNRNEADGTNITIAVAGANMFLFNDTAESWERIDSSLTKFETATGKTTHRTRWEFFAYNGSGTMEVGTCNGVDNYRVWNGTVMTQYAGQPKCRYFLVHEDTIYSAGADANPLTMYYTGASPANAQTLDTNDVDVGNEADGRINGLFPLAQTVMAGKNNKVYYFDAVTPSCLPLDSQNGQWAHRATKEVGNGIFIATEGGIDILQQKRAVTGAAAVESQGYSDDLGPIFDLIEYNQLNASCGEYIKALTNYYISFDTGNDNVPDRTLVYSSLVGKAWSEYTFPAIYCFGLYIDTDNVKHYVMGSANAGILYEIESGWDDDGTPIEYSFKTKEYTFDRPFDWKDVEMVTISGLKNEGGEFEFSVLADGNEVYSATLDDTFLTSTSAYVTIGTHAVGTEPVGGGGAAATGIDVFPYQIRLGAELFASGQSIQIQGEGTGLLVMTLDKIEIKYQNQTDDLFPSANFA